MEQSIKQPKSDTAIIVIDIQNDYCHEEGALATSGLDITQVKNMVPTLKQFLQKAKTFNVPIIYVKTIHHPYTNSVAWTSRIEDKGNMICKPHSWGAEFYELSPREEDIIITKHRYSAFFQTSLETILSTLDISTLIITGVSTNVCVDTTARDGFMRDYHVIVPSDTSAAYSQEEHQLTLNTINYFFGKTCSSNEIIEEWEKSVVV